MRLLRTCLGLAREPHENSGEHLTLTEAKPVGRITPDLALLEIDTVVNGRGIGGRDRLERFSRSSFLPPNQQLTRFNKRTPPTVPALIVQ
jgi:hypothetical protein